MPKDILLNDNYDLLIEDGDFVIGESTYQHQKLLLLCNKGEFKEFPTRCVGAIRYIEEAKAEDLAREIETDFSKDGMKVSKIDIEIPNVKIDAVYG